MAKNTNEEVIPCNDPIDQKYLHSSRRTIEDFYREATKNQWIKN